jgi:hypothetical protein
VRDADELSGHLCDVLDSELLAPSLLVNCMPWYYCSPLPSAAMTGYEAVGMSVSIGGHNLVDLHMIELL